MAERVISSVSKHTRITKENLVGILNDAVKEVNEIHKQYDKFFVAENGNPSHLEEIESKLQAISAKYTDLFEGTAPTKVEAAMMH